ncbi:MAG: 16S rRNA (guanine(527)-N(7))-methyltransferase RsmG [Gammaproteobacteria bacterium]|uniref:Ribosomal RNA small subunit methyltransferase G n=1 Tax=Candidatus Thiopontia autotrophica TaxID=2841688 RepID=A0A8J6TN42_9GAMM|nr:16S rRNA (guanine(527)-N(7))-methyltransferase RsmG [Candidatus Thiopontia autotrophica]
MAVAAEEMGVDLTASDQQQIERYLQLLTRWNRVYNLTAIRDPAKMVTHHILDSFSVIPFLSGKRIVDLGSGAGLPGIPIAIMHPDMEVVMVDSNIKKSRFIQQAILELGLSNASVVHSRVEDIVEGQPFDTVVSRAFTSLSNFLVTSLPLLKAGGRAVAMKGKWPEEEGGEVISGFELEQAVPVKGPGIHAERHMVVCSRQ